jgi:hypothetical protein
MAVLGAWFVGQQCSRLAARLPAWCASERGGGGNWEEGRGLGREFAPVMH